MFNFLALLDIRVFGRLYLWLLIGLALFLQPGCFCLAYSYNAASDWPHTFFCFFKIIITILFSGHIFGSHNFLVNPYYYVAKYYDT